MGDVDEFLRTLGSNLPPIENRDHMSWKLTKNGDFDIQSFYNKRSLAHYLSLERCLEGKAPRHVSFFVWIAVWDKILTGDNLRGRGMDFVD